MKIRKINKIVISIFVALIMMLCVFNFSKIYSIPDTTGSDPIYHTREIFDFNYDWQFSKGEGIENSGSSMQSANSVVYIPNDYTTPVYSNDYEIGVDHTTWQSVSLPHTYNDTDTFDDYVEALNLNGSQPVNGSDLSMNGERTMYGGTAWYKKSFYIPSSYEGRQIFIEFEAARQSAQIWINGVAVPGKYLNGFIAFGYDLTSYLTFGTYNTITVLVDNSFPYYVTYEDNGTPTDYTDDYYMTMYDVENDPDTTLVENNPIPWHDSHWHPNYGGLYRNSKLYVINDLHLTLPLYSFMETEGTYIYTSNENGAAKKADINIKAQVKNSSDDEKTFDFVARVFDMNGNFVAKKTLTEITYSAGQTGYIEATVPITNVKRWSPDYPNLYQVECVIYENDVAVDSNLNDIGVRTFRATTDGGFLINENYLCLEGWGQKSTMEWAGIGAAYPNWMQEYVLQLMKDAGANYIRWGHTAGSATQIDIANKLGLIVTQPGVDGEGNSIGTQVSNRFRLTYNTTTKKIRTDAFRDMILQFRNSPSILFWELGNYGGSDFNDVYTTIRNYVNTYDYGNRESNLATNVGTLASTASLGASTRLCTSRSINTTTIANLCEVCETTQGNTGSYSSGKPLLEGENNRYEARRGVWDVYTEGFEDFSNIYSSNNTAYQNLTSERLAVEIVKQNHTQILSKGLNHMGGANWIFSDSISHARVLSEVCRTTGEVDATMLKKESYYVSQVINTEAPTSHIIGHWNYPADTVKTVYVVSKADTLTLEVPNGSGGFISYTDSSPSYGYLFEFNNVAWHSGTITCRGYDINGNELLQARDSISTVGEPASIRITNSVANPNGLTANGSDYLILDVELVDSEGRRCLTYDGAYNNQYVTFTVANENSTSIWRGSYNSGIEKTINQKNLYFEAGIIRVALRTTLTPGSISVSATMGSLVTTYIAQSAPLSDSSDINNVRFNYISATKIPYSDLSQKVEQGYNTVDPLAPLEVSYLESLSDSTYTKSVVSSMENFEAEFTTLNQGNLMYSDMNMTYKKIPNEFLNAEMLIYPNIYYESGDDDLFYFTLKQNCSLLLLFPLETTVPSWVTTMGLTATNNYVVSYSNINNCANNGTIYRAYTKALEKYVDGELFAYQLGAQSNNNRQYMYLTGFYIPPVVQVYEGDDSTIQIGGEVPNGQSTTVNFYEPLNNNSIELDDEQSGSYTTSNGYYILQDKTNPVPTAKTSPGRTSVEKTNWVDANNVDKECLLLKDYATKNSTYYVNDSNYCAGVYVPIGTLSNTMTLKFDYLMANIETLPGASKQDFNRWARIMFEYVAPGDTIAYDNEGNTAAYRLYYECLAAGASNATSLKIYGRDGNDANHNDHSYSNGVYKSNTWYSYKIDFTTVGTDTYFTISIKNSNGEYVALNANPQLIFQKSTNHQFNYIGFVTGGNRVGINAVANIELITTPVEQTPASITAINIGTTTELTEGYLTASCKPNNYSTDFIPTTYVYNVANLTEMISLGHVTCSVANNVSVYKWIDIDNRILYINIRDATYQTTTYRIYFSIDNSVAPPIEVVEDTLAIFGNQISSFNKNTSFYYIGEYDPLTLPMPDDASDFTCSFGTVTFLTNLTSRQYLISKRIEIKVTENTVLATEYFYTFSYSYYSEFYVYERELFYDVIDLQNHEYRAIDFEFLYENNNIYKDSSKISSVPYEYSGAEFIQLERNNILSNLMFKLRYDSTLILLVSTHDILQDLFNGVNYNSIITGWTYNEKILSLDDGSIFSVFTKNVNANTVTYLNYNDFKDFSFVPVLCVKPIVTIQDKTFMMESFQIINEDTNLPWGWDAIQDLPTSDADQTYATITHSYDDGGKLIFVDTSPAVNGKGGTYASIQRSFSDIENTFTFSAEIKIASEGNEFNGIEGAHYVRFWLMDGRMTNFSDKSNVGLECYLHTVTAGEIALIGRQTVGTQDTAGEFVAVGGLPYDTWLTIKFTINPVAHSYFTEVDYVDEQNVAQHGEDTQLRYFLKEISPLRYLVDKVNNLVVATSGTGTNNFSLRKINIDRVSENIITAIKLNGVTLGSYDEFTKDYIHILRSDDALPLVSVQGSVGMSTTINPIIAIDPSYSYYSIKIYDTANVEHEYKVYLYTDNLPLLQLKDSILNSGLSIIDYTTESWTALENSLYHASMLLQQYNHNYRDINTTYNQLQSAFNNLVRVYVATLVIHDEGNGTAIFTTNDVRFASGETVAIIATPRTSYVVKTVVVTDANGINVNMLSLFTFNMPASNVTVEVYFVQGRFVIGEIGKDYNGAINGNNAVLQITEKSSLSAQFVNDINYDVYQNVTIEFQPVSGWTIPAGTKIIMLDITSSSFTNSYYYICNSAVSSIPLINFIKMGTSSTYYTCPQENGLISHKLVFIVDFFEVTNLTSGGFALNYKNNLVDIFENDLTFIFNVVSDETTSLEASSDSSTIYKEDTFSINTIVERNLVTNSLTRQKELTILISLADNSNFPENISVSFAGQVGKLSNDFKTIAIPVPADISDTIDFGTMLHGFTQSSITLKIELYACNVAGYCANGLLLKSTIVTFENILETPAYAINGEIDDIYKLLHNDSTSLELNLNYINEVLNASSVEVSLLRRNGLVLEEDIGLLTSVTRDGITVNAVNGVVNVKSLLLDNETILQLNLDRNEYQLNTTSYYIQVVIKTRNHTDTTMLIPLIYKN